MWPFRKRDNITRLPEPEPEVTEAVIEGARMWVLPSGELLACRQISQLRKIIIPIGYGLSPSFQNVVEITFSDTSVAVLRFRDASTLVRHLIKSATAPPENAS